MNARMHPIDMAAYLSAYPFAAGSIAEIDWTEFTPSVEQIEREVERCIDDNCEHWSMFDGAVTADTEREMSGFFGEISSLELRQMQYDPAATAEQVKEACMELRKRFIDAELELLTSRAKEQAKVDAEWERTNP